MDPKHLPQMDTEDLHYLHTEAQELQLQFKTLHQLLMGLSCRLEDQLQLETAMEQQHLRQAAQQTAMVRLVPHQ